MTTVQLSELKSSCDSKTRAYTSHRNTFGTLPQITCPGATYGSGGCCDIPDGKKLPVCYVNKFMSAYPNVKGVLQHNTDLLLDATVDEMTDLFESEFQRFKDHTKKEFNWYRLYWSGDIHNEECAQALRQAIHYHSDVNFWGYTRSFFALPYFAGLPNCTLYLSLDQQNLEEGLEEYGEYCEYDNLSICYLGKEKPEDIKLTPCPVDTGKLKATHACYKCKLCMKGKPIWFKQK